MGEFIVVGAMEICKECFPYALSDLYIFPIASLPENIFMFIHGKKYG